MSFNSVSKSVSVSSIGTAELCDTTSSEVVVTGQSSDVVVNISSEVVPEYSVLLLNCDVLGFLFLDGNKGTIWCLLKKPLFLLFPVDFELQMVFTYTDNSPVVLAITVEVRIEITQMGKDNLSWLHILHVVAKICYHLTLFSCSISNLFQL